MKIASPQKMQTATEAEWLAALDAKMNHGLPRAQAVIQLSREQPELRRRLVAEANAR